MTGPLEVYFFVDANLLRSWGMVDYDLCKKRDELQKQVRPHLFFDSQRHIEFLGKSSIKFANHVVNELKGATWYFLEVFPHQSSSSYTKMSNKI